MNQKDWLLIGLENLSRPRTPDGTGDRGIAGMDAGFAGTDAFPILLTDLESSIDCQ